MKKIVFRKTGEGDEGPWQCEIDGVVFRPLDEVYEDDFDLGSHVLNPLWDHLGISVEFIEP